MKRILLYLVGFLFSLGVCADTTHTISFNGSDKQSTAGYFKNSSKHNFNTKFNGASYAGINFTSGLKMEGQTTVEFTNKNTATVIIVQSTWSTATIKFGGNELAINSATSGTGCRIYTITDVEPGTYSVARGDGESGVFYISVTEAASTSPTVENITLSSTYSYGTATATPLSVEVTKVNEEDVLEYQWFANTSNSTEGGTAISGANNASYTPDISAVGTTYYYCVITEKDGDNVQVGSPAITNTVTIEVIGSVEAPLFTEFNGTVQLNCATTSATIYYSIDDGATWYEYTRPFTILDKDLTVKAKAEVGGGALVSSTVSHLVESVKAKAGSTQITLYYNTDEMQSGENSEGISGAALIGNDGSECQDWSIEIVNAAEGNKTLQKGNDINGKTTIKNSNGRQLSIMMPAGVVANRITIYSYVNNATPTDGKNFWSEVCGTTYGTSSIAMTSFQDTSNPDVRVYALDNIEDEITLNNNGVSQLCFYAVIDYTIAVGSVSLNSEGFATFSSKHNVHVSGAEAYTCTINSDASKIEAHPIASKMVPAYTGVLLYGQPNATVTLNYQKTAEAVGSNDLKPTTTADGVAELEPSLALSGGVFMTFVGTAFQPEKAYFPWNLSAGAKTMSIRFFDEEGEATAVTTVSAIENDNTADAKKYVKDGQLFIQTANGSFTIAGARIK